MMTLTVGETIEVGFETWAGAIWAAAVVEKVCPVRVKVRWIDPEAITRKGATSYVPPVAIRRPARR